MKAMSILASAALVASMVGCKDSEAPRTPLGAATADAPSGQPPRSIAGDARVALDSANQLFRARRYHAALALYNRAAALAPTELAPLLGIMMVAEVTGDAALATQTRLRVRKVDPSYADNELESHSKIMRAHPKTSPATPQT